jgi:hypothetical protein
VQLWDTAQAGILYFAAPTGTWQIGQVLTVHVRGTSAQALTYNAVYVAGVSTTTPPGIALPTTTTTTQMLNLFFEYNCRGQFVLQGASVTP